MTLKLTCKGCREILAGENEDELVAHVQAHVRNHARERGREHSPTREQILARLAREEPRQ